jgi:hypothetical protein
MTDETNPPEDNVVQFKRPSARTGKPDQSRVTPGSGGRARSHASGNHGYQPGQTVRCRIIEVKYDGYAIDSIPEGTPGFVRSHSRRDVGDEIFATFEGFHDGVMHLTERIHEFHDSTDELHSVHEKTDNVMNEAARFGGVLTPEQIDMISGPGDSEPEKDED